MRRTVLLFLAATLALALAAGTAFAVNKMCPQNCRGTSEGDRLVGSARGNTIYALAGSDRVLGRGGNDALKGGDGRDEVFGQEDNDRVKGSFGRDRVYGGPGDDLVRGARPSRQMTERATSSTAATARRTRSTGPPVSMRSGTARS